jgi:hypothetical protein
MSPVAAAPERAARGLATVAPRLAHVDTGGAGLASRPRLAGLGRAGKNRSQNAEKPAAAGAGRAGEGSGDVSR